MQSITEYSPWNQENNEDVRSRMVLVLESMFTFGEFSWTMLIVKALKTNIPVKIVAMNHSKSHFISIIKKHGIDFTKLELMGRISILVIDQVSCIDDTSEIWLQITTFLNDNDSKPATFIDSLDCLQLLAPEARAARLLIAHLYDTLSAGDIYSLALFGKYYSTELDNKLQLSEFCKYRADIMIIISQLPSGYSVEVGGQMLVSSNGRARNQTYIFKALDTGVKCSILSSVR